MTWNPKPATVEAFTEGDCWALAIEIHRLTGYPIIFSSSYSRPRDVFGWDHVAVVLPDNRILDVNGVTDSEDWCLRWNTNESIETTNPKEIADLTSDQSRRFLQANARATARRLTNHFNIPTTGRRHRDALPL